MNFAEMVREFRRRTGYTDKSAMPDRVIVSYFNDALRDPIFARHVARRGIRTASSEAYRDYYTPPDDMLSVERVIFRNYKLDPADMDDVVTLGTEGWPERYLRATPRWWWMRDGDVHIYPIPSDAATSTTLSSSITATDTSCTVEKPADGMPSSGRIIIGNEVIEYLNATDNGTTYTLSPLRRGMERTEATSHNGAVPVTLRDIEMIGLIRPIMMIEPPGTGQMEIASVSGNMDAGQYRYIWCYYDPSTGRQSLPFDLGIIDVENDNSAVLITDLQMDDYRRGYQKRIYRTNADQAWPYYLVDTVGSGYTSYTDTTADINLSTTQYSEDDITVDAPTAVHSALIRMAIAELYVDLKRFTEASAYKAIARDMLIDATALANKGDGPKLRRPMHSRI